MQDELKKTLWAAADKLRSSMDAAEYKHIVLGRNFLKYISDAFDERRSELRANFHMANLLSDIRYREGDRKLGNKRWIYGPPLAGKDNYARLQALSAA